MGARTAAGLVVCGALGIATTAHAGTGPSVDDAGLAVTSVVSGLNQPTSIGFEPASNNAFVLEKDTGRIRRLSNGVLGGVVLDLDVANDAEQGLLGIAVHPRFEVTNRLYVYYTASGSGSDGGDAVANHVERYRWNGSELVFGGRIKTLPATPGPNHQGGKIEFGPDKKLYIVTGDLNRNERTENYETSGRVDRHGVILRLNEQGAAPRDNPFFDPDRRRKPISEIYAYGVRNSFGIGFDPKRRGRLWDTENGPNTFDEINLVKPGFNSGWEDYMGPVSENSTAGKRLVKLGDLARYSDPEFSWRNPVAATDLEFGNASLGAAYDGDLFVGDFGLGNISRFDLNATRNALVLSGNLADRIADDDGEASLAVWGQGFGGITDIVSRPDGLYVLTLDGVLYRISQAGGGLGAHAAAVPEPAGIAGAFVAAGLLAWRRRGSGVA